MIQLKYKGRSFASARSLSDAIKRDMTQAVENKMRQAAYSAGASIQRTAKGYEVKGNANQMGRFYDRLGK